MIIVRFAATLLTAICTWYVTWFLGVFEMATVTKHLFKMRPLHVDVSPLLQQVSEARGGVGRALGGQDHVNRPATLEITAVDPPLSGLHQEPNGG